MLLISAPRHSVERHSTIKTLSISTESHYAECQYAKSRIFLLLYWTSLSWVSLCWMLLCWVSWCPYIRQLGALLLVLRSKGTLYTLPREYYRGKYHCTVDLLFGLESAIWHLTIFVFICKTWLIQSSQTAGLWYIDTFPFSSPCLTPWC
jgi:hypothetical protein